MPSISVTFCRSYAPFLIQTLTNMQFSALFFFDILSSNFVYDFVLMYHRASLSFVILLQLLLELCLFVNLNTRNKQFSALFSYMLWHIELKCCIWLCFTVLQIKFECRQFASSFVGVMPLLELRILEIHSFPHFSLTPFNILSWKFAYYFVFLYYRSSLSVVNLRLFFGVMPLFELRIL